MALLSVGQLQVRFRTHETTIYAVNGVSFDIDKGETLGIVGESGCGKSATGLAIMRLLPKPAGRLEGGTILYEGRDLASCGQAEMRTMRGRDLAMIFQDPMTSLNPVLTIGEQMVETIQAHLDTTNATARARAEELLTLVGIPAPARRMSAFPHEFSGGMRQRVLIGMALALEPRLLIADEPTTGLDVTTQAQILELLERLTSGRRNATIFITHDLGIVARMAQRIAVMYAGRIVETGPTAEVFARPSHPYTAGLLRAMPHRGTPGGEPLTPIEGMPPDRRQLTSGCPFAPRCARRLAVCIEESPALTALEPRGIFVTAGPNASHQIACHNPAVDTGLFVRPTIRPDGRPDMPPNGTGAAQGDPSGTSAQTHAPGPGVSAPLVEVEGLKVCFPIKRGILLERHAGDVQAVGGVSFAINRHETLGLVGESGCGKTTTGLALLRLCRSTSGAIRFDGVEIASLDAKNLRAMRRRMQMIFQDSYASLNPRMTVAATVSESLEAHVPGVSRGERREQASRLLSLVGLDPALGAQYPHELSGGQRQRVGIARALAPSPDFVVADEPVRSLDASIQAQIINLMRRLQDQLGVSFLLIAHDLAVVSHISHRIAVMYLGRIVELADRRELNVRPLHPYSVALLSAVPVPDPSLERERRRIVLNGEIANPVDPPSGCRFAERCWLRKRLGGPDICVGENPRLRLLSRGHEVACHFAEEVDGSSEQTQGLAGRL